MEEKKLGEKLKVKDQVQLTTSCLLLSYLLTESERERERERDRERGRSVGAVLVWQQQWQQQWQWWWKRWWMVVVVVVVGNGGCYACSLQCCSGNGNSNSTVPKVMALVVVSYADTEVGKVPRQVPRSQTRSGRGNLRYPVKQISSVRQRWFLFPQGIQ